MKRSLLSLLLAVAGIGSSAPIFAQSPAAILYQGTFSANGAAYTGQAEMQFTLWNDPSAGSPIVTNTPVVLPVSVSNGLFNASLDFGPGAFPGAARWLQIDAQIAPGPFTALSPRQRLAPTPYAIRALEAGGVSPGSITAAMLADGAVTGSKLAPGAVSGLGAPDGSPANALVVNTNGQIGVGTNSPQAALHLVGGTFTYGATLLVQQADETDPFGYSDLRGANDVAVSGQLIAVAASSDAAVTPVFLNLPSVLPQPELRAANGFNQLAGATAVAFSGNLLAIAAATANAVTLADLSAPATPVKRAELRDAVGGFNELGGASAVAFNSSLLAIAANADDAVTLVDVTAPAAPALRAVLKDGQFGFDFLNGASAVAFNGNLLAIAASVDSAISLVDVSTPTAPLLRAVIRDGLGGFDRLGGVNLLAWSGNILVAGSASENSVSLINCAVPSSPALISTLTDGVAPVDSLASPGGLAVRNGLLAVTARGGDNAVTLFDLANPAFPAVRGVWRHGRGGIRYLRNPAGIAFVGTNLVVTGDDAFTVIAPTPQSVALASEGWVGVGTTRPAAPLHVVGNVIVENAGAVAFDTLSFSAGYSAIAAGNWATAFGGSTLAAGDYSLAAGLESKALGQYSVALGYQCEAHDYFSYAFGSTCLASNTSSFALGTRARTLHPDTFVWSDGSWNGTAGDFYFNSTRPGQLRLRARGGVEIIGSSNAPAFTYSAGRQGAFDVPIGYGENTNTAGNSSPVLRLVTHGGNSAEGVLSVSTLGTGNLARFGNAAVFVSTLTANGTWTALAFNPTSDRNAKENLRPINPRQVLDEVVRLPLARWNYKAAPDAEHVGPVAQDFHAAFGLNGDDDTHIATVDADGVALAAIQGLNQKLEEKDTRLRALERELAELKALVLKVSAASDPGPRR